MLAISDEKDLLASLEQIRSITDLDGAIWWWPYLTPASESRDIRRRDWPSDTSKAAYTAATYLSLFVNNVLGLRVDVPARTIAFRPFRPWNEFSWDRARLGRAVLDCAYRAGNGGVFGRVVNRNSEAYEVSAELTLPPGVSPGSLSPDST